MIDKVEQVTLNHNIITLGQSELEIALSEVEINGKQVTIYETGSSRAYFGHMNLYSEFRKQRDLY